MIQQAAQPLQKSAQQAAQPVVNVVRQAAESVPAVSLFASAQGGELSLGEFGSDVLQSVPGLNEIRQQAEEILSPFKTLLSGIRSFTGNLSGLLKNKKALLFTALMAVVWIALGAMRNTDSSIVKTLSWLTCSEGGLNRGLLGGIGGTLGKGATATALFSLFSGGLGDTLRGVKSLFSKGGEKRSLLSAAAGALLGGLGSLVFTGTGAAAGASSMAGISGALLSLQALGSGQGWLSTLAQSLTAKMTDGVRLPQPGAANGLLTGMTGGFTLAALLTSIL